MWNVNLIHKELVKAIHWNKSCRIWNAVGGYSLGFHPSDNFVTCFNRVIFLYLLCLCSFMPRMQLLIYGFPLKICFIVHSMRRDGIYASVTFLISFFFNICTLKQIHSVYLDIFRCMRKKKCIYLFWVSMDVKPRALNSLHALLLINKMF